MVVAINVTTQPVWPPRALIALTGLTPGDQVTIYRQVSGGRTPVRGGHTDSAPDTVMSTVDAELPFGVPVTHVAVVEGTDHAASPVTYTLAGGKVALSDAITGLAAEVVIMAAEPETHTREGVRFRVAGRVVIVGQPMSSRESQYELFVANTTALENLETLLKTATQGIVQIRQPGGYDGIDAHIGVDAYTVLRWSQDGSDNRRTVVINYGLTGPWPDELAAASTTYAEVEDFYAGLSYADAEADHVTYFDAQNADYS